MATRAEWFRYHAERAGPKKAKQPKKAAPGPKPHNLAGKDRKALYAFEEFAPGARPSRKSSRKASNRQTWEAGVLYQSMDKDAMFAQMIDSDFANGNTDGDGWGFRAGYVPVKNIVLNATYYINTLNKDVAPVSGVSNGQPYNIGRNLSFDRLQLDLNYKF